MLDEGLVGGDDLLGGGGDVIGTELRGLKADVMALADVDGVKLELDEDLGSAVEEVGEGQVDGFDVGGRGRGGRGSRRFAGR